MANCVDKGKDDLSNCKEFRDDGYEKCDRYEDQGYESCDRWDADCCDWWPCSWACKIVSWICAAWTWISNVVCVAFVWVANVVCVAWNLVAYMACLLVDAVVALASAIIDFIELVAGWFLSVIAWFVDLILSIPIIGRAIKSIWNTVLTIFWGIVSIVDAAFYFIGIRPEKRLRVCTLLLCDARADPEGVAKRKDVVDQLNKAISVFRQAHVRIICSRPLQIRSGLGDPEVADDSWITAYCQSGGNTTDILNVECNGAGYLQDLWLTGPQLQFILDTNCAFGNYRRLIGYGAPVAIFVVKDVGGDDAGGCGTPAWDYILVEVNAGSTFEAGNTVGRTIAHELAHACNLFHVSLDKNLMKKDRNSITDNWTDLTVWQEILIRMSRHVTYL